MAVRSPPPNTMEPKDQIDEFIDALAKMLRARAERKGAEHGKRGQLVSVAELKTTR